MRQETGIHGLGGRRLTLCLILGHRRSIALAFTDGDRVWHSRCKRCGKEMVRLRHKRWVVADLRSGLESD